MKRALAWLILIGLGFACPGQAGVPPVGPSKCVGNCGSTAPPPPPPPPPPRRQDDSPAPGPSSDQIQREQRAAEMQALLRQSEKAEREGNLEEALSLLGQADAKADTPEAKKEIEKRAGPLRATIKAAAARAARERQRADAERAAGTTIDGLLHAAPDFDRGGVSSHPSDDGVGNFKPADAQAAPMPPATDLRPNREPNFYPARQPPPPLPLPKGLHFQDVPVPAIELMPKSDPRFPFDRATLDMLREVLDQAMTTPPIVAERLMETLMRGAALTPSALQAASYVDGMVQAYAEGRRRRLEAAPPSSPRAEPPPPPQASSGRVTERDALIQRINAAKMDRALIERNAILAQAVRDAPVEAPEAVLESLQAQYRLTGNLATLQAVRYLEGGRRYGEVADLQGRRQP